MGEWLSEHWLDLTTTILGLLYIILEYRVSIWLWVVGFLMPALDIWLYWEYGLYGDSALAVYYLIAYVYGLIVWHRHSDREDKKKNLPITHMPGRFYIPATVFFIVSWAATWYVLVRFTNSTVPVLDSFTNALSFVALWALSRKYIEQWLFWIVVDVICCYLYVIKGIPFKAGLYGLYVIIAVAGYIKWTKLAVTEKSKEDEI